MLTFLVFILVVPLRGQSVGEFGLFTECALVRVIPSITGEEATEIGLTGDRIETMGESRLRAARLWSEQPTTTFLAIGVAVFRGGYAYDMTFYRSVPLNGVYGYVGTWRRPRDFGPAIGTHGGDAGFIVQRLSESLDEFVLEYLRANEGHRQC